MKLFLNISTIFISVSWYAQVNLNSSLTACYALNNNANEAINALNGTLSSVTATVDRFNNPNSSFAFSGNTSSFIQLPNSPLLKANSVSFSAWVRFNQVNTVQYIVFTHNGCLNYHEGYMLCINNWIPGGYRLQMAKANNSCSFSGQATLNGSQMLNALTWYHVGFYIGPDSLKLYLNGNLESTMANPNPLLYNPNTNVYLGGSNIPTFNAPLNGCLDNVRFYNRKLNGAEFKQLYLQDPLCSVQGLSPVASFSSNTSQICVKDSITFTDQSTNSPNAWSWSVSGPINLISTSMNPTFHFYTPGTYTVSLVSSNNFGSSNTATQSVVVHPLPNLIVTATKTVICRGESTILSVTGAFTYSWSNSQFGPSITVNPLSTTNYSVYGTSTNGCANTANFPVTVTECIEIKESDFNEKVLVFPNPGNGRYEIAFPGLSSGVIMVFNTLTEMVYYNSFENNQQVNFDINTLAIGVYYLQIITQQNKIVRKIIKD